jgi:hypothetical protein
VKRLPVDIPKRALELDKRFKNFFEGGPNTPALRKATRYNWSAQVSRDSCGCHLADEVEDVVLTSKVLSLAQPNCRSRMAVKRAFVRLARPEAAAR